MYTYICIAMIIKHLLHPEPFVSCITFKPAPEPSGEKHPNPFTFPPQIRNRISRRVFFAHVYQ